MDNNQLTFFPPEDVLFPPLSEGDISFYLDLVERMENNPMLRYSPQNLYSGLRLLRFIICAIQGIQGYENLLDEAGYLIRKVFILNDLGSSYFVAEYFYALCFFGCSTTALGFYLLNRDVLDRPHRYNVSKYENTYVTVASSCNRLHYGLSVAITNGHPEVLEPFLQERELSPEINSHEFVTELCDLLHPCYWKAVENVYRKCRSKWALVLNLINQQIGDPPDQHEESAESGTEQELCRYILCTHYNRYYDDIGFLTQAVSQNPDWEKGLILANALYDNVHLSIVARAALRRTPKAYRLLPGAIQRRPDVKALYKEE